MARVLLVALAAVLITAPAQPPDLDAFIRAEMDRLRIPGMAVGVVQAGQVTHLAGYGDRSPAGEPVTPQTQFLLGSTTKSFTALAVMQLVEAGMVELDAPVVTYLPWFEHEAITVRHLLYHTSGYTMYHGLLDATNSDQRDTALEEAMRARHSVTLAREPGSAFEYSNLNYALLGLLVQEVSGESYERIIRQNIYEPLGMENSYTRPNIATNYRVEPHIPEMAVGHRYWFGQPRPAPDLTPPRAMTPAGFLISTAEDMTRYLSAHLEGGTYEGVRILSEAGIEALHTPSDSGYAMGWVVDELGGVDAVWHNGATAAFHSMMVLAPEHDLGFIVLMNVSGVQQSLPLDEVGGRLLAFLLGEPVPGPQPNPLVPLIRGVVGAPAVLLIGWAGLSTWLTVTRWRPDPDLNARRIAGRIVVPLLADAAFAAVLVLAIPRLFGVPLPTLVRFSPVTGALLLVVATAALTWGAARTVLILTANTTMKGTL